MTDKQATDKTLDALPLIVVRLPPKHPSGKRIMWDYVLGKWVTLDEWGDQDG